MSDLPTLRCSELDRTFRCPGWRVLARAQAAVEVRDEESEASTKGTWGHYLIARWAMLYMQAYAPDTGLPHPRCARPRWSPVERWAIVFCVRELRATCDIGMILEVEVELVVEFDGFILSGHIDVMAITGDARRIKCWDWKLGRINVDPADLNNQVMGYIVLLFLTYEDCQEVTFYLVQPFSDVDDGYERVTEVTVTREQFAKILQWFVARIRQALRDCLELDSGPKQCRYCPVLQAGMECPAIKKQKDDMKYRMTPEEVERLTTAEESIETLIAYDTDLQALSAAGDAVRERIKTLVRKNKAAFQLQDGRRVYLKPRRAKRIWAKLGGRDLYGYVSGKIGEDRAIELFKPSVNAVKEEFAQVHCGNLPKTSKKGPSVESRFNEEFGGELHDIMGEVLCIDKE